MKAEDAILGLILVSLCAIIAIMSVQVNTLKQDVEQLKIEVH